MSEERTAPVPYAAVARKTKPAARNAPDSSNTAHMAFGTLKRSIPYRSFRLRACREPIPREGAAAMGNLSRMDRQTLGKGAA